MCGITGIYNFRTESPVDGQVLESMTALLIHRGPDAGGTYINGAIALGHRRLSILDLSERGRQPMVSQDGRYIISYNGEVYNYVELRRALEQKGEVFKTGTDTEVVLTLYARYGSDSLTYLNGMFAFAIWDTLKQKLFLARDRIGIKPLYYAETTEGIIFASEIKALLSTKQIIPQLTASDLDTYMTYGYVPGEQTLFHNIRKLAPGHWLAVNSEGIRTSAYWDLSYTPDLQRSERETAEQLRALLSESMQIHVRSDVPVGVFLSGGLDSSSTVALLAEAGYHSIKTFSVAYREGKEYDETRYARLVADHFQTEHHVLYVDPESFLDFIPSYVWWMDEPVTEAAAISLYFISRLLRAHVTVALSGEGADELFAGYDIYRYMQWLETYRLIPEGLRALVEPAAQVLGGQKVAKYLQLSRQPLEARYLGVSLHEGGYKDQLYTADFRAALALRPSSDPRALYYEQTAGCDVLTRMMYFDLKTWLVDDLLIKADKMTMANSVELRVPFLDHRIVEYAATIPSRMKLHRGKVKWILKQAMKSKLPKEILARKKVGFPTPLALMFQKDLSGYLRDLLLSRQSISRGYFKPQAIENLIEEHLRRRADHHKVLWQLVVLEEWHRRFIDRSISASGTLAASTSS